jgi:hypothetical protein
MRNPRLKRIKIINKTIQKTTSFIENDIKYELDIDTLSWLQNFKKI